MESEHLNETGTLPARMRGELTDLGWYLLQRNDTNPVSQPSDQVLTECLLFTTYSVWQDLKHGGFYRRITIECPCLQKRQEKTEKQKRKETMPWASSVRTSICNGHSATDSLEWAISETFHQGFQWLNSSKIKKWQNNLSLFPWDFKSPPLMSTKKISFVYLHKVTSQALTSLKMEGALFYPPLKSSCFKKDFM